MNGSGDGSLDEPLWALGQAGAATLTARRELASPDKPPPPPHGGDGSEGAYSEGTCVEVRVGGGDDSGNDDDDEEEQWLPALVTAGGGGDVVAVRMMQGYEPEDAAFDVDVAFVRPVPERPEGGAPLRPALVVGWLPVRVWSTRQSDFLGAEVSGSAHGRVASRLKPER